MSDAPSCAVLNVFILFNQHLKKIPLGYSTVRFQSIIEADVNRLCIYWRQSISAIVSWTLTITCKQWSDPSTHNKACRNTLAIQLLRYSPCSPWFTTRQLHPFFFLVYFSILSFAAHLPQTSLIWAGPVLHSSPIGAFTYKLFPGLIAPQYNLHLYSPPRTNMIWCLCPW